MRDLEYLALVLRDERIAKIDVRQSLPRGGGRVTGSLYDFCGDCGLSHRKPDRLARIRRMLPASPQEIREAYPCVYDLEECSKGERRLYRDLHDLGAKPLEDSKLWAVGGSDDDYRGAGVRYRRQH